MMMITMMMIMMHAFVRIYPSLRLLIMTTISEQLTDLLAKDLSLSHHHLDLLLVIQM
jgi:hypothetical protein